MKPILISLIFVLICCQIVAQECGECSRPKVAFYDFEMKVARPGVDSLILKWMNLFWVGPRVRNAVKTNEPNSGCIGWYDGAAINALTVNDGTLKFGTEYTNLPAPGPFYSSDYILWGNVTGGTDNVYTATLILETGPKREIVKQVSVDFVNESTNPDNAGYQLATALGPILQTIRNFEVYKRSTDNTVAIKDLTFNGDAPVLVLNADKTTANAGEKINIEMTLTDCDGVPLNNRTIHLKATTFEGNIVPGPINGSFSVDQVTTDESGKASAEFTPAAPGLAVAKAAFLHYKPVGRFGVFIDEANINVPNETVEFEGSYKYNCQTLGDTSWTQAYETATMKFNSNTWESVNQNISFKGILGRDYKISGLKVYNQILSLTTTGSCDYKRDFYKNYTVSTAGLTFPQILIENEDAKGTPISPDIEVIIAPNDVYPRVTLNGSIYKTGNMTEKTFTLDNGWQTNSIPVDDTSSGYSLSFSDSNTEGKTIVKNKNVYTCSFKENVTSTDWQTINDYHGHSLRTVTTTDWFINIKLNGTTTGSKTISANDNSFYQNEPNPFRSYTDIKFNIPTPGVTSLVLYDLMGNEIAELLNSRLSNGSYSIQFDGSDLQPGIYFCKLQSESSFAIIKMIRQ